MVVQPLVGRTLSIGFQLALMAPLKQYRRQLIGRVQDRDAVYDRQVVSPAVDGAGRNDVSLSSTIDDLGLPPGPTRYLKDRWLDQLLWFEAKAAKNQRSHRILRSVALVGGVVSPVVVNISTREASVWVRAAAVAVSLVVGIAVAVEGFLRPGERWLQFRQTAELLRSEWWLYSSLAGDYATYDTISAAHPRFVERVESIVSSDVAGFVAIVNTSAAPAKSPGPVAP